MISADLANLAAEVEPLLLPSCTQEVKRRTTSVRGVFGSNASLNTGELFPSSAPKGSSECEPQRAGACESRTQTARSVERSIPEWIGACVG